MVKENKSDWKQATSGDVIKLEEGQRVEGIFKNMEASILFPSSFAVTVEVKGEKKILFANSILHDLIVKNDIKLGQEIAILYVGEVKNQQGTRTYKNYELFYR